MSEPGDQGDQSGAEPPWVRLHEEACARGDLLYPDPATGLMVCTRVYLLKQGKCCKSGCRHCPYGYRKPGAADDS